jgi:hypothetical protein
MIFHFFLELSTGKFWVRNRFVENGSVFLITVCFYGILSQKLLILLLVTESY